MNIRVQGERVLVKQNEKVEVTKGGLYLGEGNDKKRPSIGEVVSVGNGITVSSTIKVKDKVMFDQYSGQVVDIDEQEYKVINYIDILLVDEG